MTSDEFRALRIHLRLSQAELATRLGTHQPNIARIERGERQPTTQQAATITLLADLLACRQGHEAGE